MYYEITYRFKDLKEVTLPSEDHILHPQYLLYEFINHQGHMTLEKYYENMIHLLCAYPSYLSPIEMIVEQVQRYLDVYRLEENFDIKRIKIKGLSQNEFFERLLQIPLRHGYIKNFDVFFKRYYLEPTMSTNQKSIGLPSLESDYMKQFIKFNEPILEQVQSYFENINTQGSKIIIIHSYQEDISEWCDYFGTQLRDSISFNPMIRFTTEISKYMPLYEFAKLNELNFRNHILGQQWVIEIEEEMLMDAVYAKVVETQIVPQIQMNKGLGQIFIHCKNQRSIASWFNNENIIEIYTSHLFEHSKGDLC